MSAQKLLALVKYRVVNLGNDHEPFKVIIIKLNGKHELTK